MDSTDWIFGILEGEEREELEEDGFVVRVDIAGLPAREAYIELSDGEEEVTCVPGPEMCFLVEPIARPGKAKLGS